VIDGFAGMHEALVSKIAQSLNRLRHTISLFSRRQSPQTDNKPESLTNNQLVKLSLLQIVSEKCRRSFSLVYSSKIRINI